MTRSRARAKRGENSAKSSANRTGRIGRHHTCNSHTESGGAVMKLRQLFVILAVALMASCGGGEKKSGAAAGEKTLVIEAMSSPTNLDVRVGADNVSGRIFDLVYSGLVKVTPNFD